jgi:diguanylate cyclase
VMGAGVMLSNYTRDPRRRFLTGSLTGTGVAALHYLGMAGYLVEGVVVWNLWMAVPTAVAGVLLAGVSSACGRAPIRWLRKGAPLMLLLSIAVLHFGGMAAVSVRFDPRYPLPADAVAPALLAPVVAAISVALLALAVIGFTFSLAAARQLRRDRARLRELAEVALEGLLVCDGEVVSGANKSMERLYGAAAASIAGMTLRALLPGFDVLSASEEEEHEAELADAGGVRVPVRVLHRTVSVGARAQTVVAVRDQRERLNTEARIRRLAFSDALTGLPNRARFHDLVAVHAASRRAADAGFAVLMIDLDRFKLVNDTLGHDAGDQLLRQVAERLSAALRDGDVVARLGGDEFAVLQVHAPEPECAHALAARIVSQIDAPFVVDGQAVNIGASVGVALAPADGDEPAVLLRNADLALYKAKADGKGAFRMFEPALDARMQQRRLLESGLRQALARGEFELHYQPLADARTGRTTGAEALVRWRHPERGLVSPADFIPVAEETGLIGPLGQWVLRTACAEAARWPEEISVAVNLSPVQFRDGRLADTVAEALADAGLPARRLELEITEGLLLSDEERTLHTLRALRASGVRISMDDFGTGYSSLSYLRRFPFDKIKVDQSFVRQLPTDPESAAIVRAIITMGACLGMSTTVEGVETAEQLAFTAAEGCDQIQGYLISRPLPVAEFRALLDGVEAAAAA